MKQMLTAEKAWEQTVRNQKKAPINRIQFKRSTAYYAEVDSTFDPRPSKRARHEDVEGDEYVEDPNSSGEQEGAYQTEGVEEVDDQMPFAGHDDAEVPVPL